MNKNILSILIVLMLVPQMAYAAQAPKITSAKYINNNKVLEVRWSKPSNKNWNVWYSLVEGKYRTKKNGKWSKWKDANSYGYDSEIESGEIKVKAKTGKILIKYPKVHTSSSSKTQFKVTKIKMCFYKGNTKTKTVSKTVN